MQNKVPLTELNNRINKFRLSMDKLDSKWEIAIIISKINLYYFTGTMQNGILVIPKDKEAIFWVKQSYKRAIDESLFPDIRSMNSYRDAANYLFKVYNTIYLETEKVPLAMSQRLQKHFKYTNIKSVDMTILNLRSIKSEFELSLLKKAGQIHKKVLEDRVPQILEEGMTEAELAVKLYSIMIEEGHHGIARFGMFDTEILLGHICFGKGSIYPTYFNGPGGNYGMNPAVPLLGSHHNKLKKGDLVFIDIGCGVEGYHTDKTMTYMFGKSIPEYAIQEHKKCVQIQNKIASMLTPKAAPSNIYNSVINALDAEFIENFMGYGDHQVRFLGHGTGLVIDEMPVIANGFDNPIEEGMVFALEPKKGIKDIGMVGIENTFLVTPDGGKCITGNNEGLIKVY